MEFTAKQIAELIQGRVEGNENAKVSDFAKIEEGREGCISFLANPKYQHYIYETKSSVVLVNDDAEFDQPVAATLIRVPNAYESVARLLQIYQSLQPKKTGIDTLAFIDSEAQVSDDCYVGAFAYIGKGAKVGKGCLIHPHACIGDGVTIGDGCQIYPNVTIYHGCKLGNNVTIHAGSVIGADGFGFAPNTNGYEKIPQIGIVVIEDNVEIGANTCIDRSTMGQTLIRKGVKLDNLIQVAHNVEIGENTVMSAQVGVAGSEKIGSWCMVGGQVGFAGHHTVGDRVMIGAQSGVLGDLKDGAQVMGPVAMDLKVFMKSQALMKRLPDMYKDINDLKKKLNNSDK